MDSPQDASYYIYININRERERESARARARGIQRQVHTKKREKKETCARSLIAVLISSAFARSTSAANTCLAPK